MKQWTHSLRAQFSDFFLRRWNLRAVRWAERVLSKDQRRSSILKFLRRNRLQRWRNWLFHQLVLNPLGWVQKVGIRFTEVVRRSCWADTNDFANLADIFLRMLIIALMMWQFGFSVWRRGFRNKLKVVEVLGESRKASNIIVDLIDLVIFVCRYLTIRNSFLLLLHFRWAGGVFQHVTVWQKT